MALAILKIIFSVLIIVAIIVQVLLYKKSRSQKSVSLIYWTNLILALIVSALIFSSLPSNFVAQKILAGVWGVLAILGIIMKKKRETDTIGSKLLLSVSVIGSMIQLVFG